MPTLDDAFARRVIVAHKASPALLYPLSNHSSRHLFAHLSKTPRLSPLPRRRFMTLCSSALLPSLLVRSVIMGGWPTPPKHSLFVDNAFKFVVGFGLTGGAVWKFFSLTGGDHHDHEAMQRTENAKELERLVRRHSTHTNMKGELHKEAATLKNAA